uniref:Ig-like domain-containing protein n=1 Tax=Rhodnius prolixus TaxID=13249 RepID=T1I282_RHOPR
MSKLFRKHIYQYKLGTSSLHSVEWYKDGRHFYTFIPKLKPQVKFFPLENIQFDISESDMHRAALNNVTSEYSGNYKCEVFIENQKNFTVQRVNLTVFAYPDRDPIIQFKKHNYNSVEEIAANCTSGRTIPPSTLFWFINGVKIDKKLVIKEEIKAIGRFFRTLSTIKFTVEKDSDKLVLGCVARIFNSLPVTRTSAFIPTGKSLQSHSEKLLHGSVHFLLNGISGSKAFHTDFTRIT